MVGPHHDEPRHPWTLRAVLTLITVGVAVLLATSDPGGDNNYLPGADGVFSIETDPTIPQFGEPNIHVGYDGDAYEPVFIRRVVDLDDEEAVVNLTLAEDR